MSAPQFTPGPWKVVPYGDGDSLVISERDDNWRICFMATPGESPDAWEKIKANARVIAASPDLYEALKSTTVHLIAAISLLDKIHADVPLSKKHALFGTKLADYKNAADIGRAVLAKAQGRSA